MCQKESRGSNDSKRGKERDKEWRQRGRQARLRRISPSSITLNRKVIDYERRAEQGKAEHRVVTLACMQITRDMLILP